MRLMLLFECNRTLKTQQHEDSANAPLRPVDKPGRHLAQTCPNQWAAGAVGRRDAIVPMTTDIQMLIEIGEQEAPRPKRR